MDLYPTFKRPIVLNLEDYFLLVSRYVYDVYRITYTNAYHQIRNYKIPIPPQKTRDCVDQIQMLD